jgi:hypothetical protein
MNSSVNLVKGLLIGVFGMESQYYCTAKILPIVKTKVFIFIR